MKANSFAVVLLVFQLLTVTAWADDIKQADYPIQYEVLSTSRTDKLVIQKVCLMTLRDQTKVNAIISVSRKRVGSCQVLASGAVYNGRQSQEKRRD